MQNQVIYILILVNQMTGFVREMIKLTTFGLILAYHLPTEILNKSIYSDLLITVLKAIKFDKLLISYTFVVP